MHARKHLARGFTLIELMIVVAVIAIIAAIALPNLLSARIRANETAAVANLKALWTGEVQLQQGAKIDVDSDGVGEFGFLRELSGGFGVRDSADGSSVALPVAPAPVSVAFGNIDANGSAQRTGYHYMVVLPGVGGDGVHETGAGAFDGAIDADMAEGWFCIYAWPIGYSRSGDRTFFVNLSGAIINTEWDQYTGDEFRGNTVDGAAFVLGAGPVDSITGDPAVGTYGRDLNWWIPVR